MARRGRGCDRGLAKQVADALGVELQVLPGLDHLRAFSRIDLVMPLVLGLLAAKR